MGLIFPPSVPVPSAVRPAAGGLALDVANLNKRFGDRQVLSNLNLTIQAGSFVAIVGHSGCGKSTFLRLLAGLDHATAGRVALDGVRQRGRSYKASDDVRIMFQDARLLPWKTVIDNVALGLPGPMAAALEAAHEALAQVGLADRAWDWPACLSGGQRQRVALARALVHRPRLLLLDEPLGALDALTRIEMQELIESLWRKFGFTAVLVTHDVPEAVALADRVVLMDSGKIALDLPIALDRPRHRGAPAFAALEERILEQVLSRTPTPAVAPAPAPLPQVTPPARRGRSFRLPFLGHGRQQEMRA